MKPIHSRVGLIAAIVAGTASAGLTGEVGSLDSQIQAPSELNEILADSQLKFSLLGDTEITLYGFVRVEGFYDFDFQQGDLSRSGRVGDAAFATDGAFDTSVRVSRFGIRSATQTEIGTVGTQLEFDLFGSGGDDSGSPNLRLRHANLTIGDSFLFGQTWTNFMPLAHYPRTSDFNGPVGITFARVPQARYTFSGGDGLQLSASIEESNGSSDDPVITAASAFAGDSWSARVAGLAGSVDDGAGGTESINGVTLSGAIKPWDGGSLGATFVTGDGMGAYLIGGGDAVVGGQANGATGYTLELRQQIGENWNFGVAYGAEDYDLGTLNELETIHVNAFYNPIERLTVGLEYIHVENTTSGVTSDADRLGASVTFSF